MFKYLHAFACLLLFPFLGLAQLTLQVTSIPANTPAGDTIFVAGNFNGWDPGNVDYALSESSPGVWEITISPEAGTLEFKFTRGSWPTVEGNAAGGYLPNRTYLYDGGAVTLELEILSWEGSGSNSTAAANVQILDDDFYMPQLDRNRRIWIYLPPDYEQTNKDYPVLYMHDGQNLFDVATAFSGEWEVDESLNALFDEGDEGFIVVGIENGGSHRLNEYSPWVNPQYGGGEGAAYVDFIVETLKPYIDENFRTRSNREYTGIMGSSMGGLISLYAAIEHQEVFSKAGVFSASFWFADESYSHVSNTGKMEDMRIYMIAGALEGSGGGQVSDMNAMYSTLLDAGFSTDEVIAVAHEDGQHSEWYWAREFPDAYEWLFAMTTSAVEQVASPMRTINVYPNPADSMIQLKGEPVARGLQYEIWSPNGKRTGKKTLLNGSIPISHLANGNYLLLIYQDKELCATAKFTKQ